MTRTPSRSVRPVLAVIALCALGCVFPVGASAHGDWPYHALGPLICENGRMVVYGPKDVRSSYSTDFRNPEKVEWSPDVYRYNRRGHTWKKVYSGIWYYGFASDYGLYQDPTTGGIWHNPDYSTQTFVPVTITRGGSYKVRNYIYWPGLDATHRQTSRACKYKYTSG